MEGYKRAQGFDVFTHFYFYNSCVDEEEEEDYFVTRIARLLLLN